MLYERDTGLDGLKHSPVGLGGENKASSSPIKLSTRLRDYIIQVAKVIEHWGIGSLYQKFS